MGTLPKAKLVSHSPGALPVGRRGDIISEGDIESLPDNGLRYGFQAGRYLHPLLPLLPPGVRQHVEVVWAELGRVRQLHGRDEVGAEHLGGAGWNGQMLKQQSNQLTINQPTNQPVNLLTTHNPINQPTNYP